MIPAVNHESRGVCSKLRLDLSLDILTRVCEGLARKLEVLDDP